MSESSVCKALGAKWVNCQIMRLRDRVMVDRPEIQIRFDLASFCIARIRSDERVAPAAACALQYQFDAAEVILREMRRR